MKMKSIFVFALTFSLSLAVDVAQVETELLKVSNELILSQSKLRNAISVSNSTIRIAASNLNSSTMPRDFVAELYAFGRITKDFLSIDSYEKSTSCDNETTDCICMEFRTSVIRNNIIKIENVMKFTLGNSTKLWQSRNKIFLHYMSNYNGMVNIWTKEALVLNFFRQSVVVLNEFGNYLGLLKVVRKFLNDMNVYLNSEMISDNCSSVSSPFSTQGDQIEDKLKTSERKLVNLAKIALEKVNKSRNAASSDLKPALDGLFDSFSGTASCDDFNGINIQWPHIPDKSGATMRVRSCQARKESFSFSAKAAAQNQSTIREHLDKLKAATKVSAKNVQTALKANESSKPSNTEKDQGNVTSRSRKVRAVSADIYETINATTDVVDCYTSFLSDLNQAITEVDVLSQSSSLSLCNSTFDALTSTGSYYKTICALSTNLDFPSSQDLCRAAGLKLLQILNYDDYIGFLQAAFSFFGPFPLTPNPSHHLDGTLLSNGTWFAGSQRIYSGIGTTSVTGRNFQVIQTGQTFKYYGVSSTLVSNAYCELVKTSMNVSTAPITTLCRYRTYIRDRTGKYQKTACVMIGTAPQGDIIVDNPGATAYCSANRMKLYEIRTADHLYGIQEFIAYRIYGQASSMTFHVAGTRLSNGSYIVGADNTSLPKEAIPTIQTGTCLAVAASGILGRACSSFFRTICEFTETAMEDTTNKTASSVCGIF